MCGVAVRVIALQMLFRAGCTESNESFYDLACVFMPIIVLRVASVYGANACNHVTSHPEVGQTNTQITIF
jgi:hypothetical protein